MKIPRLMLLAGIAFALSYEGALANVIIGATGVVNFTIQSVSPSSATFTAGSPDGTFVAAINVQMSPGAPAFTGSLSISGTDSASFRLSSTTLPSNILLNGTPGAGAYSINIIASMAGIANSPFTQPVAITGIGGGAGLTDPSNGATLTDPSNGLVLTPP